MRARVNDALVEISTAPPVNLRRLLGAVPPPRVFLTEFPVAPDLLYPHRNVLHPLLDLDEEGDVALLVASRDKDEQPSKEKHRDAPESTNADDVYDALHVLWLL